jgi:nucleoid-associated protein YgaU
MIGHNNPPDPIDIATEPFGDTIAEAEAWLDGKRVENEGQLAALDVLIKGIKSARKAVDDARDVATKPLHEAWKAESARWKPTQDDLDRLAKGLVALGDPFRRQLAEAKEAARKEAERIAWEKTRAAQEAARVADAANIEETRAAAQKMADAEAAQKLASAAKDDTVKGLRTYTETVVIDPVLLARWLWTNDKEAQLEFQADRARKLGLDIPGVVEQRKEKRAV